MKVLLINSDGMLTDDLEFFIQEKGHKVDTYSSAKEVLDNLNNLNQYNSIVLSLSVDDTNLDKSDLPTKGTIGESLYQRIRATYNDKKIIITSNLEDRELSVKFHNEPNTSYIKEPLNNVKLNQLLDEALR